MDARKVTLAGVLGAVNFRDLASTDLPDKTEKRIDKNQAKEPSEENIKKDDSECAKANLA